MATIDILGVSHAYNLTPPTASPSPVLVFLHGWMLSRSYWQPLIDQLASDYQCLAYDLRGFGESQPCQVVVLSLDDVPTERYTPAAYARDLGILLEELNIDNAWLVGHSLGGAIALWGAFQFPDRVKGVCCINSGGGIYIKEEFERFRAAGQQLLKRRPRWLESLPLLDLAFTRAMVARPIKRRWGRQRVIDFVRADQEAAVGTLLEPTTEAEVHQLPQIVSQLEQPVYFIAGAKDRVMEPKYVLHLASFHKLFGISGENVVEIPNCGHLAMLEQPEVVAKAICEVLVRHSKVLSNE